MTVMSETEYTSRFGDPDKNGLGHQRVSIPGCPKGVLMPGRRIWKIRRSQDNKATLRQVHMNDDQQQQLGDDMLDANFAAFEGIMFGTAATGVAMDLNSLAGGQRLASAATPAASSIAPTVGLVAMPASSQPAPASSSPAQGSSQGSPSMSAFGFFNIAAAPRRASAEPEVELTPAKAGKKNIKKPLASPGESGKPAVKGRGAPPRDLIALAKAKCAQWAALDEKDAFWHEIKAHVRTNNRFYTDIEKRMQALNENSEEWTIHKLYGKRIYALKSVQYAFQRGGGYSKLLAQAMDDMDHYLSMEPYTVTDFTHPVFLNCQRHEMHALQASCQHFWQKVQRSKLLEVGYLADNVAATQEEFMSQKITAECEKDQKVAAAIKTLKEFFSSEARSDILLEPEIEKEVALCCALVNFEDASEEASMGLLRQACEAVSDSARPVLNAFTLSVNGAALVDLASRHFTKWEDAQLSNKAIESSAGKLAESLLVWETDADVTRAARLFAHVQLEHQNLLNLEGVTKDKLAPLAKVEEAVQTLAARCLSRLLTCVDKPVPDCLAELVSALTSWDQGSMYQGPDCTALAQAAGLVPLLQKLFTFSNQEQPVDFDAACVMLSGLRTLSLPGDLKATLARQSGMMPSSVQRAFLDTFQQVSDEKVGARLFAIVRSAVNPLLDQWVVEVRAVHAPEGQEPTLPLTINLEDDDALARYSVGITTSPATLLDTARKAGDEILCQKIFFLRDVHLVLRATAELLFKFQKQKTPEERKVTQWYVKHVRDLQVQLLSLETAPVPRFRAPAADELPFHFAQLDGLVDSAALRAEVLRQCGDVISSLADVWVKDVEAASQQVEKFCLSGWVANESLLQDSDAAKAARKALLTNPNYKDIGPAVEMLEANRALLETVNMPGHAVVVPAEFVARLRSIVAHGLETVVITFCLFLVYEKIPRITDPELKKAEVEGFRSRMAAGRREIPQFMQKRLDAIARPEGARDMDKEVDQ
jgi:hypothetical protein